MTTVRTKDYLLGVAERFLPGSYVASLKEPGPGYEVLQAAAAVFERVSAAAVRLYQNAYIVSAEGGSEATAEVEFYRSNAAAGGLTILAGTVVRSKGGRLFVLPVDVPVGAAALTAGPHTVRATVQSYQHNEPGPATAIADGTALQGEIDTVVHLRTDPPYADPTLRVRQVADAEGGAPPALSALGEDRGITRSPGESVDAYRVRIRQLLDTVSYDAIVRLLDQAIAPYGGGYTLIETYEETYQTCWDAPAEPVGAAAPTLFVYDDPADPTPFQNRWLDTGEHAAAFIVVLPLFAAILDMGGAYDDTAVTKGEHASVFNTGWRAQSAYDIPASADEDVILPLAYDGLDLPHQAFYRGIFERLQRAKAGGVAAVVEVEGQ